METAEHRRWKSVVAEMLRCAGWIVALEHRCADIVAIESATGRRICLEIERSERNWRRNVRRNLKVFGSPTVIVATSDTAHRRISSTALRLPLVRGIDFQLISIRDLGSLLTVVRTLTEDQEGGSLS